LFKVGQAQAAIQGRDYVIPDDIKAFVETTLAHRMVVEPSARIRHLNANQILQEIVSKQNVPGGKLNRN
jgi:MoxR-like ATPase